MANTPMLPFFTDAYLADTQHLTLEEHGAYLKLLIIAWRSPDCSLPDDDKRLATMLGITLKKWKRLRPTLDNFFQKSDKKLHQKRLQKERNWVEQKRNSQARAGKVSALKRKETTSADVQQTLERTYQPEGQPEGQPEPQRKGNPSTSTIKQKTTTTNEAALALKMLYRSIEERVFGAQRRQMPAGSDDRVAREWLRDGITARLVEEVVPGILERFKATNDGQPPGSMGYCTKALLDARPKPNGAGKIPWWEDPEQLNSPAAKEARLSILKGKYPNDWEEHARQEGLL